MSHKLPRVIPGSMFICSCIIMEASQVVLCTSQPSKTFDCTVRAILYEQGVGISLKMQGVVNENSGGGQILTVYQGKAEVFLEMKSISEVQCHILILFSTFMMKKELFLSVLFTCDFPKTKIKCEQESGKEINLLNLGLQSRLFACIFQKYEDKSNLYL